MEEDSKDLGPTVSVVWLLHHFTWIVLVEAPLACIIALCLSIFLFPLWLFQPSVFCVFFISKLATLKAWFLLLVFLCLLSLHYIICRLMTENCVSHLYPFSEWASSACWKFLLYVSKAPQTHKLDCLTPSPKTRQPRPPSSVSYVSVNGTTIDRIAQVRNLSHPWRFLLFLHIQFIPEFYHLYFLNSFIFTTTILDPTAACPSTVTWLDSPNSLCLLLRPPPITIMPRMIFSKHNGLCHSLA